ncbi:hypothetical protein C357_19396 [Citreicella sp. 357]|nr:hypothetical protein C357_19396 [Citreicella sp. 357]
MGAAFARCDQRGQPRRGGAVAMSFADAMASLQFQQDGKRHSLGGFPGSGGHPMIVAIC